MTFSTLLRRIVTAVLASAALLATAAHAQLTIYVVRHGQTDINGPFEGQPIQGFSSIKWQKDGSAWILSDNGFGTKANSPDAMLMFHHLRPDWKSGRLDVERTIFLHDPHGVVPFNVVNSATAKRYSISKSLRYVVAPS